MEPEGSLPRSQQPANALYSESHERSPNTRNRLTSIFVIHIDKDYSVQHKIYIESFKRYKFLSKTIISRSPTQP
jgi:hypothetical protein